MKTPFMHLILSGIICVAVLVGYSMWYAVITAQSAAVTSLQNQINAKTETVNRANTTRVALAEIASDEIAVQSYFVPESGVVTFIDSLEAQGRSFGAALNVLSVSTEGTTAQPMLVLSLSIKGTFDAVMRTLGAIEYAPYAISVTTLSVVQDAKNSWHADLKIRVGSSIASTTDAL